MKYIILTLLITFLSCNSTKNNSETAMKKLGSTFEVTNFEKSKTTLKVKPTLVLNLEKNTISGHAGCNRYSGEIIKKENTIKFNNLVATKMYCNNMKIEKEFLSKMATITTYEVKNNQFLLFNKAKELVFTCSASK